MKNSVVKKKLVLERETITQLSNATLEGVNGGLTPFLVSVVITMLSCGFFCNPQKAR